MTDLIPCASCSADLHPRDDTGYTPGDILVCQDCGAMHRIERDLDGEFGIAQWWCEHSVNGDEGCGECERISGEHIAP